MGTQEFKDDALPSKKELQRVESPFDFKFENNLKSDKEKIIDEESRKIAFGNCIDKKNIKEDE